MKKNFSKKSHGWVKQQRLWKQNVHVGGKTNMADIEINKNRYGSEQHRETEKAGRPF
ncbi:hypothetical protein HY230_06260 [Candidatus Acetothermia bacterium]|nr:hypothetical protein [Candidatus Acetothermia bacterium]